MTLQDLVKRPQPALPWAEGDNIPWNDPGFSERMLREHLDQDHDLASRRRDKIAAHVDWIHRCVLHEQPARILDLTCGPGLYTSRLAKLGHECVGVDFSPAAIAYATEVATRECLACTYVEADVRSGVEGADFALVMMLWGQFNVFRPADARALLGQAHRRLSAGGQLLLEPQSYEHVKGSGDSPAAWYTAAAGLFSDRPHLVLQESFWDAATLASTMRFFVIDAETGATTRHALSNQAYDRRQLREMVAEAGFTGVCLQPSLTGDPEQAEASTFVMLAAK